MYFLPYKVTLVNVIVTQQVNAISKLIIKCSWLKILENYYAKSRNIDKKCDFTSPQGMQKETD